MCIKEIIEKENANKCMVYLYKEGIFWRSYELSLYLLTTHIKPLKVLAKRYKNIGQEVVYGGFPDSALTEVLNKCKEKNASVKQEEKIIEIGNFSVEKEKFVQWKAEKIVASEELKNVRCTELAEVVREPEVNYKSREPNTIEEIKKFPIAHRTPIEALQFLARIQEKLKD